MTLALGGAGSAMRTTGRRLLPNNHCAGENAADHLAQEGRAGLTGRLSTALGPAPSTGTATAGPPQTQEVKSQLLSVGKLPLYQSIHKLQLQGTLMSGRHVAVFLLFVNCGRRKSVPL